MNKFRTLLLVLLVVTLGCENYQNEKAGSISGMVEYSDMPESEGQTNANIVERKLIKDGDLAFETNDMVLTRKNVLAAVKKHNGYSSSDEAYRSTGMVNNTIVVRVPANKFDALLADISQGVDHFDRKNINTKDVTEEFLDISTRIKTKKELEKRYLELLDKAKTVTEMLEIERQVGQLRSEIESIEGRLKYLENRASFATLTINYYKNIPTASKFGEKFTEGFRNGWDNLIWFFVGLVNVWPFVLLIIALIFGIRAWRRKRRG